MMIYLLYSLFPARVSQDYVMETGVTSHYSIISSGLYNILTRICVSLGLRMQFKTLYNYMSDEEKHGHHSHLPLFFNIIFMLFLAPGGLSAECVKVS